MSLSRASTLGNVDAHACNVHTHAHLQNKLCSFTARIVCWSNRGAGAKVEHGNGLQRQVMERVQES